MRVPSLGFPEEGSRQPTALAAQIPRAAPKPPKDCWKLQKIVKRLQKIAKTFERLQKIAWACIPRRFARSLVLKIPLLLS
ncbi:hypothetical protein O77CONTIG1_01948 [Leptolyngbya sp. O-77]|nr:hypothetical protein O77CONTIG1_01948 [Leptolyngbya sp. O-77]